MSALLPLFSNNILPILLAAGVGYVFGRTAHVDARTLSRVTFFVFSPCLVFQLLTENRLAGGEVFGMAILAVLVLLLIGLLSLLVGRLLRLPRPLLVAFVLASMFGNAGNYGLSFNAFAFGEQGLAYASVYFVTSGLMVYTVGIVVASLGQGSLKHSLINLFRYPTLYAVLFALAFNGLGFALPVPVARTVTILGDAAIPAMLILLGLQLGSVSWRGQLVPLTLANGLRLVVGPLVALGLVGLLGLEGAARQAGVAESAMPTAVMATVLATEFDAEPAFATAVVTTTTLLSPLTLTPLLAYLLN